MMKYYNGRQILEEIENSTSHRGTLLLNAFALNRTKKSHQPYLDNRIRLGFNGI